MSFSRQRRSFLTFSCADSTVSIRNEAYKGLLTHQVISAKQGLYMMHLLSPGIPFFLPHGTRVITKLKDYLRKRYRKYGFQEVITPQIFKKSLWEQSSHWTKFHEDMFQIQNSKYKSDEIDNEEQGLKPMNCPGHCLIYKLKETPKIRLQAPTVRPPQKRE